MFLFLMQFVMNNLDELMGKGIEPAVIIELIVLNIAWMVVLAVPMGVLFSTLMAFGGLSSTYETTIIKASGGSLIRMMVPILIAGFGLSYFMYWYNDVVLPESNHQANVLLNDIKRTKPSLLLEKGRFIQELDGYTILSRRVDSVSGKMYGVTIYDTRSSIERNVVSADSGTIAFSEDYSRLILDLFHGEVHQSRNQMTSDYKVIDFENYQVISRQSGFSFDKSDGDLVSRGQRELPISDMRRIASSADSSAQAVDSLVRDEIDRHVADFLVKIVESDSLANSEQGASKNSKSNDSLSSPRGSERNQAERLASSSQIFSPVRAAITMPSGAASSGVKAKAPSEKETTYADIGRAIDNELSIFKSRVRSRINQKEDYEKMQREYLVEIYKKYSIPFACFVFVMVGCPLGIKTKGGNFGTSAVISLAFYVLFWMCLIGGEKLADEGFLDPWLAMWLGDIVVGGLGFMLMLKVNNENFTLFGNRD